jgi:PPOX class probable F420-dependent enzyme
MVARKGTILGQRSDWGLLRDRGPMDLEKAREFIAKNHRAVLVTRRRNGELQTSPVTVGVDEEGRVEISSRETAFKTKNLRRNPEATLCVFPDRFYGEWVQIEGKAEIVSLPEAMEPLVDYYRRIAGEHPDWDDYRAAMEKQKRVLIRIEIERAGPDHRG